MDDERFGYAVSRALMRQGGGIGSLSEKTLHSALKYYYEPDDSKHEAECGGFIADIKNDGGIIEIQTGSFFHLKRKLEAFLKEGPVTVVHPVIRQRLIIGVEKETGEIKSKRRSPKKGRLQDAFGELVHLGGVLSSGNLAVVIPIVDAEEYRVNREKKRRFRDRGYDRVDTVPTGLIEEWSFVESDDWLRLVPDALLNKPEGFTVRELADSLELDLNKAQAMAKTLFFTGALKREKTGRSYHYGKNHEDIADTDECCGG